MKYFFSRIKDRFRITNIFGIFQKFMNPCLEGGRRHGSWLDPEQHVLDLTTKGVVGLISRPVAVLNAAGWRRVFRCGAGYDGRDSFIGFCSPEPLRGFKGDGASGSKTAREGDVGSP